MKNARAKRSFRRCRHGYSCSLLLSCEVVVGITRSCCRSKITRTYTMRNDVKISDNSVNSAKFAIKFTIDILVYLILLPLFCFLFLNFFPFTCFLFWKMVKKPHCYATVVIFLTCCISLQACADKPQCKRMQSVYGAMLKAHVFQEHDAANILTCGQLCNSKIRCQSVNYVVSRHSCELNSRTKEARPEDYVQDADRVYLTGPSERGAELTLVSLTRLALDNTE